VGSTGYLDIVTIILHPFVGFNISFAFNLPPAPVALKNSEKSLSKLPVHEAVSDGVTTGADVGKQLHERHTGAANCPVHSLGIENVPRVEHV
jgi:hypothetical protein